MTNLVETILGSLSADAVGSMASHFGESPENTSRALGGIVPTILAAMVTKSEHGGLDSVTGLVRSAISGGNPIDNVSNAAANPSMLSSLASSGGSMVSSLFGSQLGPIAAALAGAFGLKGDSVRGMLGLMGPLAAGGIAKMLGGNVTSQGVGSLLKNERSSIMAALPPGISSLLAPLTGTAATSTTTTAHVHEPVRETSSGMSRWLPWLLAALAALALIFGLKSCKKEEPVVVAEKTETVVTAVPPPPPVIPVGAGVTLEAREGKPALVVFFDTGKADVSPDFAEQATKVKDFLDANPDARLNVSGYNDPTGNAAANAELSKNRAANVKAALVAAGVADSRIDLVKPVETTGTGDTNAESRRVEVTVAS